MLIRFGFVVRRMILMIMPNVDVNPSADDDYVDITMKKMTE